MAKAKSKAAEVEVWTAQHRIVGKVHIPTEEGYRGRLSDLLNQPDLPFLSLTDVSVYKLEGDLLWQAKFLAVNKSAVVLVKALVE
jgi:hypothetical protein